LGKGAYDSNGEVTSYGWYDKNVNHIMTITIKILRTIALRIKMHDTSFLYILKYIKVIYPQTPYLN